MKEYRKKNREQISKYQRDWNDKNNEKMKLYHRKYRKDNRDKTISSVRKYQKDNPDKIKAQRKAHNLLPILSGKLCERCNKRKAVDRHHEDYNNPLEVMFVCVKCHKEIHLEKRLNSGREQKEKQ